MTTIQRKDLMRRIELRKHGSPFDAKSEHDNAIGMLKQGMYPKAIEAYTRIIEHDPKEKRAYYYRAVAEAKGGNHDRAMTDLDRALDIDENYLEANVLTGVLHCISGSYGDAVYYFDKAKDTGSMEDIYNILEEQQMLGDSKASKRKEAMAITEIILGNPEALGMELELDGL
ncbi:MAG: tetratricopeptide repeat protein [Candidatus Micrarchaeota archaeon]|nr:tetratricopeptide repeat protein [Candidatus Micrarchaeota archaeon]